MKFFRKAGFFFLLTMFSSCGLLFFPPDFGPRDYYIIVPETVAIPGITGFMMGRDDDMSWIDEKPVHPVDISEFHIGKYEVTIEEFVCYLNSSREFWYSFALDRWSWDGYIIKHAPGFYEIIPGKERYPVFGVTWKEAQAYCHWLSEKTGGTYRLPTEAEWEYAAVGNAGPRRYPWGDDWNPAYCNSLGDGPVRVGTYSNDRTLFGVYDMAGNVAEWCSDYYDDDDDYYEFSPVDNPKGPEESGYGRVYRGGHFLFDDTSGYLTRTTKRNYGEETFQNYKFFGFRVVKSQ